MLTIEERINLRDQLIKEFLYYSVVRFTKQSVRKVINIDLEIKMLYDTYVSEFRLEEEALYCLRHKDDFTNHKCMICHKIANFHKYIGKKSTTYHYGKTCNDVKCIQAFAHSELANQKRKDTCEAIYGPGIDNPMKSSIIQAKAVNTNRKLYNVDYTGQSLEFQNMMRFTYASNNMSIDPIMSEKYQYILDQIKIGLSLIEVYSNNDYFIEFIKLLYNRNFTLLQTSELMQIFNRSRDAIDKKIKKLELREFIDNSFISVLEPKFQEFLNKNITSHITRYNRILLNQKGTYQEIDFLLPEYNIGFEINDISGHNILNKDINYHYSKTLMAKEQHNIRLIHIWEWELDNEVVLNWILHILNQNKMQLNIFNENNYDIRSVSKEDQISFLNQYSLDNNRNFIKCIGIYYNNELIQTISFKEDMLSICIKFGYEMIKGTKEVIKSYMKCKNLDYILTYIDLSKFTGKTFEDIGFELVQYQEPNLIAEDSNVTSKYKQVYNCGYNVYMMTL